MSQNWLAGYLSRDGQPISINQLLTLTFFFFEISIDYPEEVTNCTKTWGLQNSRTKRWIDVVSSITWVIWSCGGGFGWWCGRIGDTGKADMPSGRLAFATRHVDLMAAGMRAPLYWLSVRMA